MLLLLLTQVSCPYSGAYSQAQEHSGAFRRVSAQSYHQRKAPQSPAPEVISSPMTRDKSHTETGDIAQAGSGHQEDTTPEVEGIEKALPEATENSTLRGMSRSSLSPSLPAPASRKSDHESDNVDRPKQEDSKKGSESMDIKSDFDHTASDAPSGSDAPVDNSERPQSDGANHVGQVDQQGEYQSTQQQELDEKFESNNQIPGWTISLRQLSMTSLTPLSFLASLKPSRILATAPVPQQGPTSPWGLSTSNRKKRSRHVTPLRF